METKLTTETRKTLRQLSVETRKTNEANNIGCIRFFCGLKPLEYEQIRIELGFAYAEDFGSDQLVLSDTFWTWFNNQFSIITAEMVREIESCHHLPSDDIMKQVFVRSHKINAADLYPQSIIHNQIMNEIFNA
jgi:hypothetical protein